MEITLTGRAGLPVANHVVQEQCQDTGRVPIHHHHLAGKIAVD